MRARGVDPSKRPVDAVFRAVPSKSDTHRALVAAALARGESDVESPLVAEDTERTREALAALGVRLAAFPSMWRVEGTAGAVPGGGRIALGASGTTCRLLAAVASLGAAPSRLDGAPRLRDRPLRPLLDALVSLGARVEGAAGAEGLPLTAGGVVPRGGRARVPGGQSSQFASALLLIGARLPEGLDLTVDPPRVSMPYVRMTLRTLESFGVHVRQIGDGTWRIPPQDYAGRRYRVEGDHSSASYFLAAAVAAAGSVRVEGLDPESAQADACFGRLLREAGATVREETGGVRVESSGTLRPFDVDLADAPDLAPTVAVAALFASGPCLLRGLAHLRVKESDRLEALADNLARLGAAVAVDGDAMSVSAGAGLHGATVLTRSDHRMAMAFAVAGLRVGGVVIDDAACVEKSNPTFWDDFAALEGDGLRTGS